MSIKENEQFSQNEFQNLEEEGIKIRNKIVILTKEEYDAIQIEEKEKYNHLKKTINEEKELIVKNTQKVFVNWRSIMFLIKSSDLKRRLESDSLLFQKQLESKDILIQSLNQRLETCYNQYETALRTNYIHMDKFNNLTMQKIKNLRNDFLNSIGILKNEFNTEFDEMANLHNVQVF